MSNPSPLSNDSLAHSSPEADAARWQRLADRFKAPVKFVSFWAAIGLPFVHLSLLAQGLGSLDVILLFVGLLALNLVALYVGHDYNQH